MKPGEFKECLRACQQLEKVFLSFNANLDFIVHVDHEMNKIAIPFHPKPKPIQEISSPKDLFSGLLHSMQRGEATEIGMNKTVSEWLHQNLKPSEKKMGGQTGIMANHLALMGITPIVSIPFVSQEQRDAFRKKTVFLEGNSLKSWKKAIQNDSTKINWVFEFRKEHPFLELLAKRNTRFIASSRLDGFRPVFSLPKAPYSLAVLTGFQAIKKKYAHHGTYQKQFLIARKLANAIRKKTVPLHVELGFSPDASINREMLRLAALADSAGLDEQELANSIEFLGNKKMASQIRASNKVQPIVRGLVWLAKKLGKPVLFLHARGCYLALGLHETTESLQRIQKSLDFASVIGAAYASHEIRNAGQLQSGLRIGLSKEGWQRLKATARLLKANPTEKKAGIFVRKEFQLVLVPIRMAPDPRKIVGLGDIISASIVACRNGLRIQEKNSA